MKISLNGEHCEVSAQDLETALEELGYAQAIVATAVNGEFVSVDQRKNKSLNEDDKVEVLAPMQGG